MINEITISILENTVNESIGLEDAFVMINALYERSVECGIEDTAVLEASVAKIADKISKPVAKYNEIAGKQAEAIGKLVIKHPDKLKKAGKELPEDAYEKYHQNMLKWKSAYKTVAMGALQAAVFVVPIPLSSAVLAAATLATYNNSTDPSDKIVKDRLDAMKKKIDTTKGMITDFKDKIKNKIFKTNAEAKSVMDKIETATSSIAKESDSLAKKINRGDTLTESVMSNLDLSIDEIVLNEHGELDDRSYKILLEFIEYADYDNPLAHQVVDKFIFA